MRRFAGLYDEVAAAWQFPYYFGENLAALRECLTDLEWIPASRYLLVIRDAVLVVSEEREADLALASVLDVMDEAQRAWAKPVTDGQAWDRPARPMSVVFHAEATDTVPLRARLARCGRTALEGPIPNGPSGDA